MSREAMKLALDALVFAAYEDIEYDDACDQKVREARDALRQALAQPVYTVPPKKQWVGLTLNEAEEFYDKYPDRAELINAIDKFLEEKNT